MPQAMQGVLPVAVKLTARTLKNGTVRFRYVETFPAKQKAMVDATYKVAKRASAFIGLTMFRTRDGIGVSGTVPRQTFGNMMIGEFLCWGTIGEMKMRDLLVGAALGGIQTGEQAAQVEMVKGMTKGLEEIESSLRGLAGPNDPDCTGDACQIKRALR